MSNKNLIANEIPIKWENEDLLNFYPYAKKIQEVIQGYSSNSEPLTFGIYGEWGSGKSSLLNLIERHIEIFQKDKTDKPYIKFHYNPWLYQNKEEMIFDFFETLSGKLIYSKDTNLIKAGKFISRYSRYLKSVKLSASIGIPKFLNAGASFEPYEILQKLGEDLQGQRPSIEELKNSIDKQLLLSNKKIIIFIDDIDRLDKDEIYTLFKLVKVNADFKNLVFILCLDPNHVAKAIHSRYGDEIKSGKDFIEKIINIPIELPLVEESDLDYFVKKKVEFILATKQLEKEKINELYDSLKGYYFKNPREILRILNSFAVSLYAIGDEVNIHDLFWIEYLKVKFTESYKKIKKFGRTYKSNQTFISHITFNNTFENENEETGLRKELMDLDEDAYNIIDRLFPMKRHNTLSAFQSEPLKPYNALNVELRINHIDHFEKYFSFHTKRKISELKYSKFEILIHEGKEDEALKVLKEILDSVAERVVVYRLIGDIKDENGENLTEKVSFLVNNLSLFTEESRYPHSIELIRSFSEKLKQNPDKNKDLVISISNSLNFIHLCWFIGSFRHHKEISYLDEIEEIVVCKVKESKIHPFFQHRSVAKMVMEFWSKHNHEEFENYIIDSIDTKENIDVFFNCFPSIWNENIIGRIKKSDYVYIGKSLKLNFNRIIKRINQIYPELSEIKNEVLENEKWDEYSTSTGLDNIKQFLYWHLKERVD